MKINYSIFRPTITIENGKSEEKLVPISQVRPIKKENKKSEEKNNLEVVAADYRRHKSVEHKRENSTEKHKTDHARSNGVTKRETKMKIERKNEEKRSEDRSKKHRSHSSSASRRKTSSDGVHEEKVSKTNFSKDIKIKDKNLAKDDKNETNNQRESQDKKEHSKKNSSTTSKPESKTSRASSSDKKLVKSVAICDETEPDFGEKRFTKEVKFKSRGGSSNSNALSPSLSQSVSFSNIDKSLIVKPPNILVYADSFVAKENVKAALSSILNRHK